MRLTWLWRCILQGLHQDFALHNHIMWLDDHMPAAKFRPAPWEAHLAVRRHRDSDAVKSKTCCWSNHDFYLRWCQEQVSHKSCSSLHHCLGACLLTKSWYLLMLMSRTGQPHVLLFHVSLHDKVLASTVHYSQRLGEQQAQKFTGFLKIIGAMVSNSIFHFV